MARQTKGTEALLMWCKKNTEGYKDVLVKDFHLSWRDGLAFCALIHKFRPELIPFKTLAKENCEHNLGLAFRVGDEIGIPALLDVEDMLIVPRPDTFSVITYLSQYYHFFTKPGNVTGLGVATITYDENKQPSIDVNAVLKENEKIQKENERRLAENEKIRKENDRRAAENEKRLRDWNARNSSNLQNNNTQALGPSKGLGNCATCNKELHGAVIDFSSKSFHQECFRCHSCERVFATNVQGNMQALCVEGWPYCERCGKIAFVKSRSRPPPTSPTLEEEKRKAEEDAVRQREEDRKRESLENAKLEEEKRKIEERRAEERKKKEAEKARLDEEKQKADEKKREDDRKRQEEEKKRQEEDKKRSDEKKKLEEDKKREEQRKKDEDAKKKLEEEKLKREEEEKKRKQQDEERRRQEEQKKVQDDKKRAEDEKKQQQDEERRRQEEQKKVQDNKKRAEDEKKQQEEAQKKESERKREESRKVREAELQKLKEEEEELQRKREERRKQAEERQKKADEELKQLEEDRKKRESSRNEPTKASGAAVHSEKTSEDKMKRLTSMFDNPQAPPPVPFPDLYPANRANRNTATPSTPNSTSSTPSTTPSNTPSSTPNRNTVAPNTILPTTTTTTIITPTTTPVKRTTPPPESVTTSTPTSTTPPLTPVEFSTSAVTSTFSPKPTPTNIYITPKSTPTSTPNSTPTSTPTPASKIGTTSTKTTPASTPTKIDDTKDKRESKLEKKPDATEGETAEERLKRLADERTQRFRESEEKAKKAQEEKEKKLKEEREKKAKEDAERRKTVVTEVDRDKERREQEEWEEKVRSLVAEEEREQKKKQDLEAQEDEKRDKDMQKMLKITERYSVKVNFQIPSAPPEPKTQPQPTKTTHPHTKKPLTNTAAPGSLSPPTTHANRVPSPTPGSPTGSHSPNRRRDVTESIDRTKKGGSMLIHNLHVNMGQNEVGIAEYDFFAEEANELTFQVGDKIELLCSHRQSEWAEGRVLSTGQVGWFLPELTTLHSESDAATEEFMRKSMIVASPSRRGPDLLPLLAEQSVIDLHFVPTCDGYLMKQDTSLLKKWQRRWFSLQEDQIVYYIEEQGKFVTGKESPPTGMIPLRFVKSVQALTDRRFIINIPERSYYLQADSDEERNRWIVNISIIESDFEGEIRRMNLELNKPRYDS